MKKRMLPILITVLSSAIASATPFQQMIGEDVECFFSIRNLSEMREQLEEHPMAEIFKDESLLELLESFGDAEEGENGAKEQLSEVFEEMEDDFGVTKDEFFELFPGQISLAFYNLSDQLLEKDVGLEFIFMAEFSGDAERFDELLQVHFGQIAEGHEDYGHEHELVEEDFMGETLYFNEVFDGEETYVEDGYALVDGILLVAAPGSRLREAVEIVKEGADTPIYETDVYRRSRDYSGRGDVTFYLNLIELMPPLTAALAELPIFDVVALAGVTPQSLESALSLESVQAFFADIDIVEDGLLGHYGILYSEKLGLLSLLEYVEGELPEARYVPDDVLNSSISSFDLSAMFASLEKTMSVASPTLLPLIDIQMQTIQTNTGVDLRASILDNLGTRIVGFSVLKKDVSNALQLLQPQQIAIIDLKDAEAFSQAVNALIDSAQVVRPLIKESAYEGETIYSIVAPNQPSATGMEINYAITRSKLIVNIGHVSLMHRVLSRMNEESEGFWQNPDTIFLFERIERPNAVTRSYYDAEQVIEPFFELLATMDESDDLPESLRSGETPQSLQGAYRFVSEANQVSGGLFGRTLIVKSGNDE